MAVVAVALLLMAGLVVDGGAKVAGDRRAEAVAARAARAGADAAASMHAAGAEGTPAAHRAARDVLERAGVAGEVTVSGDRVRVNTSITVKVTFLSLIGVDALSASGSAEATSVATHP